MRDGFDDGIAVDESTMMCGERSASAQSSMLDDSRRDERKLRSFASRSRASERNRVAFSSLHHHLLACVCFHGKLSSSLIPISISLRKSTPTLQLPRNVSIRPPYEPIFHLSSMPVTTSSPFTSEFLRRKVSHTLRCVQSFMSAC